MDKVDLGWALSLERLIELTRRDRKRVVRPVSPHIVITRMRLIPTATKQPPKKR